MYARVFRFKADPEKTQEGIEIYKDGYIPEAEQQAGFVEAMLLGDVASATASRSASGSQSRPQKRASRAASYSR